MRALRASARRVLSARLRQCRQNNRVTVGKFSHQRQASAHSLHSPAESGNQKVAAPFDLRDAFLAEIEGFCDLLLCNLARPAQFLQRHFLGNELGGASLGSGIIPKKYIEEASKGAR